MADDPIGTVLAHVAAAHANGARLEAAGNMDGALVSYAVAATFIPRLLAALRDVLDQAEAARPTSFSAVGTEPLVPVAWNLDPGKLRAGVVAAITEKGQRHD